MLSVGVGLGSSTALALPSGPTAFCGVYPDAPACSASVPACTFCHAGGPPTRNAYGAQLEAQLVPGTARPLTDAQFQMGLAAALAAIEGEDADMDGVSNRAEIDAGTHPADASDLPDQGECDRTGYNDQFDVCDYDPSYVFKKVSLDFCGVSPTWEELKTFESESDPRAAIRARLDTCLDSEHWIGKDGQLWKIAHPKVRPLQAIKAGDNGGPVPLADYDHDYALFVWTQIDGHDARDVLLADYFVDRRDNPTRYSQTPDQGSSRLDEQNVRRDKRAGMLTTRWNLVFNTMFTALPRLTAAQAFRSYLGLDIAKLEGLQPVPGEPVDYDDKGVTAPACAQCHSTLDPLSYPFRNYQGLTGSIGSYDSTRIEDDFRDVSPNITMMPESGVIFGQSVADLRGWADVAANSDAFAAATVMDYWLLLFGEAPRAEELDTFETLWRDFKGTNAYSVEAMLRQLVETEAYGVP